MKSVMPNILDHELGPVAILRIPVNWVGEHGAIHAHVTRQPLLTYTLLWYPLFFFQRHLFKRDILWNTEAIDGGYVCRGPCVASIWSCNEQKHAAHFV